MILKPCYCESDHCSKLMGMELPEFYGPPMEMPKSFDNVAVSLNKTLKWNAEDFDQAFIENHVFVEYASVYAVHFKGNQLSVSKCHVIKCFLNTYGFYFYTLRFHNYQHEATPIVLPMFAVFRFEENAKKFIKNLSPSDSDKLISFLNCFERPSKHVQQITEEILPDYVNGLRETLLKPVVLTKDEHKDFISLSQDDDIIILDDEEEQNEEESEPENVRLEHSSDEEDKYSEYFSTDEENEEKVQTETVVLNLSEEQNELTVPIDNKKDDLLQNVTTEQHDPPENETTDQDDPPQHETTEQDDPRQNETTEQEELPQNVITEQDMQYTVQKEEPSNSHSNINPHVSEEGQKVNLQSMSSSMTAIRNPMMLRRFFNFATESITFFLLHRMQNKIQDFSYDDAYEHVYSGKFQSCKYLFQIIYCCAILTHVFLCFSFAWILLQQGSK